MVVNDARGSKSDGDDVKISIVIARGQYVVIF